MGNPLALGSDALVGTAGKLMDKFPWVTLVTGLFAGLGIGSVVTTLIQYALKRKETAHQSQREALEVRYKVIILLMYAAHDFKGNETAMRIHRPDIKTRQDVLDDLRAEWINMILFASKTTLDLLRAFISAPTKANLGACAISMRQDLGRGTLRLTDDDLSV